MRQNDLLDRIKHRYLLPSDYALAKKLGVTCQAISHYRRDKRKLGDDALIQAAKLLEMRPEQLFIWREVERAKRADVRAIWRRVGPLAFALFFSALHDVDKASSAVCEFYNNIHYANYAAAVGKFLQRLKWCGIDRDRQLQEVLP